MPNLQSLSGASCSFTAAYDPSDFQGILDLVNVEQDIYIECHELLYLGSPSCRLVLVKGRTRFKGYLNMFQPYDCKDSETHEMTCSIIPITPIVFTRG